MNNEPCRYCQFNGTQGCPLTNCGAFPHCPQALKINWKDSLMQCGKQDVCDKATLKTPIGDIAATPVAPSDVCIAPKPKEFSFIMELNNGAKISFEGIPNNAGLTNEQATTFLEGLFGLKETKK